MANAKISALTALTGASVDTAADLLAIVDTSASTTKKILVDELRKAIGPVLGTEQATTSGTSIDFTGIPSWVTKISVNFVGVSTNGTSAIRIQLGDAGGIETSGYLGASARAGGSSDLTGSNSTAGADLADIASAASVRHGLITVTLEDASDFTWTISGCVGYSNIASAIFLGYSKSLSAALDRVRITTVNGSDTFDAGAINILYE